MLINLLVRQTFFFAISSIEFFVDIWCMLTNFIIRQMFFFEIFSIDLAQLSGSLFVCWCVSVCIVCLIIRMCVCVCDSKSAAVYIFGLCAASIVVVAKTLYLLKLLYSVSAVFG